MNITVLVITRMEVVPSAVVVLEINCVLVSESTLEAAISV